MVSNFIAVNEVLGNEEEGAAESEPDPDFTFVRWEDEDRDYVTRKVADITERTAELDASIDEAAEGWTTVRMSKVDLTLLRLALYEMRMEGLDPGIAINEAVELAKLYGEERSPSFVNGILGKLA
ncbi:MAG: transcription antitermination factor NusB [Lachnospiraceae bacterium]|nr:transcription antitermination factor NusB [Lachnospiraceae bacterium]